MAFLNKMSARFLWILNSEENNNISIKLHDNDLHDWQKETASLFTTTNKQNLDWERKLLKSFL